MHRIIFGMLAWSLAAIAVPCRAADDPAQPGTRWVGSLKMANPEGQGKKTKVRLTSAEFMLLIKTRMDDQFTGEVHVDKGRRVMEVEGRIDKKGVADFRVTRRLRGVEAPDVVDNARHHGTFKDDRFIGKVTIPGNDARWGELELDLVKPQSKNP